MRINKFYVIAAFAALIGNPLHAAEWSTSDCIVSAEVDSEQADVVPADILAEPSLDIGRSVKGELALSMQQYAPQSPQWSKLTVGEFSVENKELTIGGNTVQNTFNSLGKTPCITALKPTK